MDSLTFGERLTQLRKEHGYTTRNDFAEKLKIPSTTLRNYETDVREPGHTFLKQISELFNVSVDYLLCLTDEKEVLKSFRLRSEEQTLLEHYRLLDPHGKEMVDFTLVKEYERSIALAKEKESNSNVTEFPEHLIANAANAQNPTGEQKQHADSIMTDDSEWT